MKDYLDDLLVLSIIAVLILVTYKTIIRRNKIFVFIFGLLLTLGAIPATVMIGLSISGRSRGIEYVLGALIGIVGILVMILSKKLSKN